ncbi:Cyclic nucleotide-binding domain-containing protein 2 [Podochytrium sp. JEL0797]|nr:Cyclic nucleotide-binding domain-containing protein 2 [Podochytrium sp. JEL0797]
MKYLHDTFMWMVQGCFEREEWKEGEKAKAKRKAKQEVVEELTYVETFEFDAKGLKHKKNEHIESLRPPKPIPPEDVRSLGSKIRRKEAVTVRDKEGKIFAINQKQDVKFSVRQFISGYRKHQNEQARLYQSPRPPGIAVPESSVAVAQSVTTLPKIAVSSPKTSLEPSTPPATLPKIPIVSVTIDSAPNLLASPIKTPITITRQSSVLQPSNTYLTAHAETSNRGSRRLTSRNNAELGIPSRFLVRRKSSQRQSIRPFKTSAEIMAYKIPPTALWSLFHAEIVVILKKSAYDRSSADLEVLFKVMRGLPAFDKLSDFVVKEVCGSSLVFREYPEEATVFQQNEAADAWYIILNGSVDVMKTFTGDLKDSIKLRSLHAGEGFGDVGLLNTTIRMASIVTAEASEMVEIDKADYNRVIKASHSRSQNEVAIFLRTMHNFAKWERDLVRAIARIMYLRTVESGTQLIEEGELCKEIYFIKQGTVALYKKIQYKGVDINVKIALLGNRAILCSEAIVFLRQSESMQKRRETNLIMFNATNESNIHSRFTIRAANERDCLLLRAFYNLQLADPMQHERCKQDGMVMDFRDIRDFHKLETQDWVYEDLADVVANATEKEMKAVRKEVAQSEDWNPKKRLSMRAVTKPLHKSGARGGAVLVCMASSTARLELKNMEAPTRLLNITEEECAVIHEEELERLKWRKNKQKSMKGLIKEMKVDCQAEYGAVIGEKVKVSTTLWRR